MPYRILVLGDSFTFGWLLNADSTFVSLLQSKTDSFIGPKKVQFLNAAAGGWGTGDYLAFVEEMGAEIRPDGILIFMNFDDISRSIKNGPFSLKDSVGLELENTPRPISKTKKVLNSLPGYQWFLEHSHAVQFLRNRFVVFSLSRLKRGANSDNKAEKSDFGNRNVRLGTALFQRLKEWGDRNGTKIFVINISWRKPDNILMQLNPTQKFFSESDLVFSKLRIPYLNISAQLHERMANSKSRLTIDGDPHPNEQGARIIAESTWPFIRDVVLQEF
ncbi:MAG: hypothetical protein IH853_14025, partial [Bacteroidetes bacterium]|nr:hypothetical protein [Bacteroidota bacterium]